MVNARGTILANASFARVKLILASNAGVIISTRAIEAGAKVSAFTAMHARIANAAFRRCFALFAVGAARANAEVVLEQVNASSIIAAWFLNSARFHLFLATQTSPALFANTFEGADTIFAHATIQAWRKFTIVNICFTFSASISLTAHARIFIVQVNATLGANRIAWIAQAFVNFSLALQSNIARTTFAHESIQLIDARGAILAWVAFAVVYWMLAIFAGESWLTIAIVAIDQINAGAFICTWIGAAIAYVNITAGAGPSWITNAFVAEEAIDASTVAAWFRQAQVNFVVASFSSEAWRACAAKVIHQICAVGAQKTRILSTIVDIRFAQLALPSCQAFAFESSLLQSYKQTNKNTQY